jgi:hypothetical protein
LGNLDVREYRGDLFVDERIILKPILKNGARECEMESSVSG